MGYGNKSARVRPPNVASRIFADSTTHKPWSGVSLHVKGERTPGFLRTVFFVERRADGVRRNVSCIGMSS